MKQNKIDASIKINDSDHYRLHIVQEKGGTPNYGRFRYYLYHGGMTGDRKEGAVFAGDVLAAFLKIAKQIRRWKKFERVSHGTAETNNASH